MPPIVEPNRCRRNYTSTFIGRYLILLCCIGLQFVGFAQSNASNTQMGRFPKKTPAVFMDSLTQAQYDYDSTALKIFMGMQFAKANTNYDYVLQAISDNKVSQIDLLYTDFPKGKNLDSLNKSRMDTLYKVYPAFFLNKGIKWRIIRQLCKDREDAAGMFHGFVIYYEKIPTVNKEIEYLESVLEGKTDLKDQTIIRVLDRNPQWEGSTIVIDVTGSMAPYTAQVLTWIRQNQLKAKYENFVFFNDDDQDSKLPSEYIDRLGIQYISSFFSHQILQEMSSTMRAGKHYENNIEAILLGLKKFPKTKEIILIADNSESPCDMKLLKHVNVPIHVIICGLKTNTVVNTDYLQMAIQTNGTYSTIDLDIGNWTSLKDQTIFQIGPEQFVWLRKYKGLYRMKQQPKAVK